MKVTVKKLADLHPPKRNVRMHTDRQLKEFKRSIEQFGQIRPMVVDEEGTILAGNGLYEALVAMGRTEVDCYVMKGMSENEKKKLMLADNKIFSLGVDDLHAFDEILKELGEDIDIPGYEEELLKTLTANQSAVDDMLNEYGTLSDEFVSNIQSKAETARPEPEQARNSPPASGPTPVNPEAEPPKIGTPAPQMRYIICPACGERIMIGSGAQ